MIKILNEHIAIVLFALLILLLLCYALPNIYKYINSAISKYKEIKKPPAEILLIEPSIAQQASLYDHGAAGIKIKLKNPMILANAKMGKQDFNPYEWKELKTEDICREKYTDYVDKILDNKTRRMKMNKVKIVTNTKDESLGVITDVYKTYEIKSKEPITMHRYKGNEDVLSINYTYDENIGGIKTIPYDEIVSIEIGDIKIDNVNKDEKEN